MGDPGYGGHRREQSMSGAAVVAAFVPTFITAAIYTTIFFVIRNQFRKIYAPRTFLGSIAKKDRTPVSDSRHWIYDFCSLSDHFVLQHNSLDAYLFLRFLKLIIVISFLGCCMTWPILIPINATGGGDADQLDRISFSNIAKNDHLWAHTVVAWGFFSLVIVLVVLERLRLIGMRQACYLNDKHTTRISARTVLFMNAPRLACLSENLHKYFGEEADRTWPVIDFGDLDDLVSTRSDKALALEEAEFDLVKKTLQKNKRHGNGTGVDSSESQSLISRPQRPIKRQPPLIGNKIDRVEAARQEVVDCTTKIDARRSAPSRNLTEQNAIFVTFKTQAAAHRAYQQISFHPRIPLEERYLGPRPKEVLWKNVAMPERLRLSKASFALVFVIAFTIFFSLITSIIGTISNIQSLANRFDWLDWVNELPPIVLNLLTGLAPPFLVSWFVSYVPKLFRHIAKLSGEPTIPQAELKTQAWYFMFQVVQVFLITTFSSGAASVAASLSKQPDQAPKLLAENLPKASNFYLTYFIIQGTTSAANNLLNYSDLFEYLFYEYFWNKTPRQKYSTYSSMRGTPWASWYPKFANLLVIAIAYACIAPLVLGFATVGIFMYYLSYRYSLLYVRQTKIDTRGQAHRRALKQIPTGIYLAELCLIGLFSARKAATQATLMTAFLVLTAVVNLVLDRMLQPLEILLGLDIWDAEEIPTLAQEDGIDPNDQQALHAASHGRRLGINKLPRPGPRILSDFFDGIISASRTQTSSWVDEHIDKIDPELSTEACDKAYTNPCFTAKIPKLWIPRDEVGASKREIDLDKDVGITTMDEAAELNAHGRLHWDHNLENVPIFSRPQIF